jgi:hypothetical protein
MCTYPRAHQAMTLLRDGNPIHDSRYLNEFFHFEMLPTSKGTSIPVLHIKYPKADTTIIYSHGNATDIGHMRDYFLRLANDLKVPFAALRLDGFAERLFAALDVTSGRPNRVRLQRLRHEHGVGKRQRATQALLSPHVLRRRGCVQLLRDQRQNRPRDRLWPVARVAFLKHSWSCVLLSQLG